MTYLVNNFSKYLIISVIVTKSQMNFVHQKHFFIYFFITNYNMDLSVPLNLQRSFTNIL